MKRGLVNPFRRESQRAALCCAGSVLVDAEQLASRLKLGSRRVVAMGLTSPHQMDPLCLSTRRHWVHWVSGSHLGIPDQGVSFVCLFFCFSPHWSTPHEFGCWDVSWLLLVPICFSGSSHTCSAYTAPNSSILNDVITGLWTVLQFLSPFFLVLCFSHQKLAFCMDFVPLCSLWKKHYRSFIFF